MKTFENEWMLEGFDAYASFRTKMMFGGLAVYLFDRQMFLIVEPTKSGRWGWHGVLLCTDVDSQKSLIKEFPQLAPHEILKKWLFIETSNEYFEEVIQKIIERVFQNDSRIGIFPKPKRKTKKKSKKNCKEPIKKKSKAKK